MNFNKGDRVKHNIGEVWRIDEIIENKNGKIKKNDVIKINRRPFALQPI